MDKTESVIQYLLDCPAIKDNPLFFNFAHAEDNNKQLITTATDRAVERPYIDGSVLKRYTFTIIDYRSVVHQAVVGLAGYPNENIDEMLDIQSIIDWIEEQNELRNFPDFGEFCYVDEIRAMTDIPNLNSVDTTTTPALAKYSVAIRIQYLDKSKMLWSE